MKPIRATVTAFFVFLLTTRFIVFGAAEPDWTTYRSDPEPGKINELVISILVDGDIVWYGTHYGLVRYNSKDGTSRRFTSDDGLADTVVNDIELDNEGVLWVATDGGVSLYDDGIRKSYSSAEFFSGNEVLDIAFGDEGVIWFAAANVAVCFDGEEWTTYTLFNSGLMTPAIRCCVDCDQAVWLGTEWDGVLRFDGTTWTRDELPGGKITSLHRGADGTMYAAAFESMVHSLENGVWSGIEISGGYNTGVYDITTDSRNRIWAATNKGLCRVENGETVFFTHDGYRFNSSLRSLDVSEDDTVWLGGYRGFSRFDGETFIQSTLVAGPAYNSVKCIAIAPDNTKWFGHERVGLTAYDDTYWTLHCLDFKTVGFDIAFGLDGAVWTTGLYDGGIRFDGRESIQYKFYGYYESGPYQRYTIDVAVDKDNITWLVSPTDRDSFVAVGSINTIEDGVKKGIMIMNGDGDRGFVETDSDGNIRTLTAETIHYFEDLGCYRFIDFPRHLHAGLTIDNEGNNWVIKEVYDWRTKISTFYITVYNDDESVVVYDHFESLLGTSIINCVGIDRNNTAWVGTDAGVARFDGETWTTFTTVNSGICDNRVNDIAVEDDNTIWFGTEDGVSKYTGEVITTVVEEINTEPAPIQITSHPNPFNPSTTISFTIPETTPVTLTIHSITGQKVRALVSERLHAGSHTIVWDGRDDGGQAVSSGLYLSRLDAGGTVAAGKMTLVR